MRSHGTQEGKTQDEARYYVSNLRAGVKAMRKDIQKRWSLEDSWHWVRYVPQQEDAHRYREDHLSHDIQGLLKLLGWRHAKGAKSS